MFYLARVYSIISIMYSVLLKKSFSNNCGHTDKYVTVQPVAFYEWFDATCYLWTAPLKCFGLSWSSLQLDRNVNQCKRWYIFQETYASQKSVLRTRAVVPNLSVAADRSTLDNFTSAREYSITVVIFNRWNKWSYQFEPSDKAATVESTAAFHLQRFHSIHATVLPWKESTNHMPRKRVVSPPVYILQFRGPGLDTATLEHLGKVMCFVMTLWWIAAIATLVAKNKRIFTSCALRWQSHLLQTIQSLHFLVSFRAERQQFARILDNDQHNFLKFKWNRRNYESDVRLQSVQQKNCVLNPHAHKDILL